MPGWPDLGTRVTVRYRRPAGSVPPLTDAVGHLLAVDPLVLVRTKTGAVVEVTPADVVALRVLTDAPVRTAQIRALEHAAALGWPGIERQWVDGWLLRAAHGATFRANSAVPLDISANAAAIPAILAWYTRRDLTPLLAIPDRVLPAPSGLVLERTNRVLVRDVAAREPDPSVTVATRPDDAWLRLYRRQIPVDVLTAVVDGDVTFGTLGDRAVARAAVTEAPDGTRWVGLSALRWADDRVATEHARGLCEALLTWGAGRGATRGYLYVDDDDHAATGLAGSLGFTLHHRSRYFAMPST